MAYLPICGGMHAFKAYVATRISAAGPAAAHRHRPRRRSRRPSGGHQCRRGACLLDEASIHTLMIPRFGEHQHQSLSAQATIVIHSPVGRSAAHSWRRCDHPAGDALILKNQRRAPHSTLHLLYKSSIRSQTSQQAFLLARLKRPRPSRLCNPATPPPRWSGQL